LNLLESINFGMALSSRSLSSSPQACFPFVHEAVEAPASSSPPDHVVACWRTALLVIIVRCRSAASLPFQIAFVSVLRLREMVAI
jgi:hypothetical protein